MKPFVDTSDECLPNKNSMKRLDISIQNTAVKGKGTTNERLKIITQWEKLADYKNIVPIPLMPIGITHFTRQ